MPPSPSPPPRRDAGQRSAPGLWRRFRRRDGSPDGTAAPVFLLANGLVLGLAVHTQNNLLFWLFGLGVGGAAFALAHGGLALRGLRVERLALSRAVAGGPLTIGYRLENHGWLACLSLRVRELDEPRPRSWSVRGRQEPDAGLPWAWVPRVERHGEVFLSASGLAPARGECVLGPVEVSTTFPLGLFRRRRVFHQPDVLQVLPALPPLPSRAVHRAARPRPGPGGHSAGSRAGAEGDFYGSRAYRVGDPLRTLDWKRSARRGELMVRELAAAEPSRVAVLLDLRPAGPGGTGTSSGVELQERAISVAASLITRAHALGFRVGLHVVGAACPSFTPHHALAHRDRLLGALCRIDLSTPGAPEAEAARSRAQLEATVHVVAEAAPAGAEAQDLPPEAFIRHLTSPAGRSGRPPSALSGVTEATS